MANNIKHLIQRMAAGDVPTSAVVCTVTAVNTTARTIDCEPLDESAPILNVNLQANQDSTHGLCLFPKVGSYVLVGFANNGQSAYLCLADEVESLTINMGSTPVELSLSEDAATLKVGNSKVEITANKIQFNGGQKGGLVLPAELTQKLNALENDINTLKRIFGAWNPVLNDGGTALKAAVTTERWHINTIQPTQQSELENPDIKQ